MWFARYRAMVTRHAEPSDLPALRVLFLRSRRAAFYWQPPDSFELEDFDEQTEGEVKIVALYGVRPVGFISVWEPDDFIHHLHVEPRLSRHGVGRALLSALPGWGAVRYRLKCVSQNKIALAFYLANNFTQIGEGHADNQDYLLLESMTK
ncbi:GNAT family N-acetyltransferase [Methylobacterium radiotolerans]|nr:GNAT family N-acetyltransferase [Methylobacterium radiotolerans]